MFNLRCTARLLRKLKCDPGASAASTTRLGDWYGNLFNVGRQQYAVFTSERSLLTVVLPAREIDPVEERLSSALRQLLLKWGVERALIDEEIAQMDGCAVTATANRSVLSSLNDFVFQSKIYLGESRQLSLPEIQERLANTPMKPLEYRFAKEVAIDLLSGEKPRPTPPPAPPIVKPAPVAKNPPPVQHVNRRGETYYLLVGKTKTGKPKYYVSKKPQGTPAPAIPEGYEIHESPANGLVHVRKIRPTRVLAAEREQASVSVRALTGIELFFIEIEDDSLVVYWPDRDPETSSGLVGFLLGGTQECVDSMKEWTIQHMRYTPVMRFTLVDEERRQFTAERWCFLGSIDDWLPLDGPAPLTKLLKKYVPHLGQESLYELM
jgi:hypothetical protein